MATSSRDPVAGQGPADEERTRFELGQEASMLVLALGERLRSRYASIAAEFGLTPPQAKALVVLQPDRPTAMRALARLIHQDPSNLTAIVDRLEERGLVERRPSAADRRVKAPVVTEAGARLARQFKARLDADLGPLERLDAAQIRELHDLLREATEPSAPATG